MSAVESAIEVAMELAPAPEMDLLRIIHFFLFYELMNPKYRHVKGWRQHPK